MSTPKSIKKPTDGRDPDATREALLAAGTELFAARGFDGARIDAIARRAGVNKAMISYHFGGKQGLYNAILHHTLGTAYARFGEIRAPGAADRRLRRFVEIFAETVTERPAFPAMMLRELLAGGRRIDDEIRPKLLGIFALVEEILAQGSADGTFRPVDPLLTHLSLLGSLVFFFATRPAREAILSGGGLDVPSAADAARAFVQHTEDLFTRGLAAPNDASPEPSGDPDAR